MMLTVGALVICHHTDRAPVWGRVASVYADRMLILDRSRESGELIEVHQADVMAIAETIAELDDAYHEHCETCGLCAERHSKWVAELRKWIG